MSSLTAGGDEGAQRQSGNFLLTVNFVFVSTVMAYGLGFLAVILISRELGAEGRGVTALFQSAVNMLFVFLSLGIGASCVYFVSKGDLTAREAMEAGLVMTLTTAALVAAGIVGTSLVLSGSFTLDGVPYWLAIVAIPGLVQFQLLECVLRGQGRFGRMNLLNLVLPFFVLAAFGLTELVWGLTIERAVYAWSLAFWPSVVAGYLLVAPAVWPRGLLGLERLKPLLLFGVQSQSGNFVQLLNYRLDIILVGLLAGTTGVGLYATGLALSEGLWFIANSAAVVLVTNLSAGDEEYKSRMTPLVCRSTLLITTVAAISAAAVSPFIVPFVFGAEFRDAVLPFLFLLPGTIALAGGKILSAYVFSRGRPTINAMIAVATLVVTLSADLALIPLFDVSGAAIASSIAYCVSLALTAIAYRRLSGNRIIDALLPRPGDAAVALEAVQGIRTRLARS